jgi:hypothetical protein
MEPPAPVRYCSQPALWGALSVLLAISYAARWIRRHAPLNSEDLAYRLL